MVLDDLHCIMQSCFVGSILDRTQSLYWNKPFIVISLPHYMTTFFLSLPHNTIKKNYNYQIIWFTFSIIITIYDFFLPIINPIYDYLLPIISTLHDSLFPIIITMISNIKLNKSFLPFYLSLPHYMNLFFLSLQHFIIHFFPKLPHYIVSFFLSLPCNMIPFFL